VKAELASSGKACIPYSSACDARDDQWQPRMELHGGRSGACCEVEQAVTRLPGDHEHGHALEPRLQSAGTISFGAMQPAQTPLTDCLRDFFARRAARCEDDQEHETLTSSEGFHSQLWARQQGSVATSDTRSSAAETHGRTAGALQVADRLQQTVLSAEARLAHADHDGSTAVRHSVIESGSEGTQTCCNAAVQCLPSAASAMGVMAVANADEPQESSAAHQMRLRYPHVFQQAATSACASSVSAPPTLYESPQKHTGDRDIDWDRMNSGAGLTIKCCSALQRGSGTVSPQAHREVCTSPGALAGDTIDACISLCDHSPKLAGLSDEGSEAEVIHGLRSMISGMSARAQKLLSRVSSHVTVAQPEVAPATGNATEINVAASVGHWARDGCQVGKSLSMQNVLNGCGLSDTTVQAILAACVKLE
jgi:hypothetical protein